MAGQTLFVPLLILLLCFSCENVTGEVLVVQPQRISNCTPSHPICYRDECGKLCAPHEPICNYNLCCCTDTTKH
ncbi:hypothetical protein RND81_12G210400 [Saponaria officinalis]|uniref:Uncharacterized protein n=1 Tax=Saponaria officinalis TaxID=3572 RepID=A0AAW1HDC7_SAPOF